MNLLVVNMRFAGVLLIGLGLLHAFMPARFGWKEEYDSYVADLAAMRGASLDSNYDQLARLLDQTRSSPYRNVEWEYWNGLIHNARSEISTKTSNAVILIAPDSKSAEIVDKQSLEGGLYSYPDLQKLKDIPLRDAQTDLLNLGGRWIELQWINRNRARVHDTFGPNLGTISVPGAIDHFFAVAGDGSAFGVI
jgi:hypothetical protein